MNKLLIPKIESIDYILVVNINDILTDNLLVEILLRLSSIDVVRTKSVCKRWRSVISEPYFIPTFTRYHDQLGHPLPVTLVYNFIFWHRVLNEEPGSRIHVISEHPIFRAQELKLDFLPCFRSYTRHPVWVTACYNDLLVCCDTKMLLWSTYYVCSPLTKQWVALPQVMGHHKVSNVAMGLVISKLGLLRLVRVPELDSDPITNRFEADVFCSEMGQWSKVKFTCPKSFKRSWQFKPNATVTNDTLHWLVNSEFIIALDPFECDKTLSCVNVIDLPSEANPKVPICLGSSLDRLRVCQLTNGYPNGELVIWKIEDYLSQNWEVECKIRLKDMDLVGDVMFWYGFGSTNVEILGLHPSDSTVLYMRIRNHIVISNTGDRTIEVVGECLRDSTFSIGTCGVFPLVHPSWPSSIPSHEQRLHY